MNKRTAIIFYILSFYVVVQFIWWGYHIIDLTKSINSNSDHVQKSISMIAGEGAVFLVLLLIGIWQIRRSLLQDIKLGNRQKNFLLSVTHELKTPLAANKLYLQTINKRDLTKDQTKELVDKAIEENVRLSRMIDNILQASRLENQVSEFHPEKFDITPLFNTLKERYTSIHSAINIQINTNLEEEINADRSMMEMIFSNLIDNAIKYAGKDSNIVLYAFTEDDQTVIGVKDDGAGIPSNEKAEIFNRFYRIGNEDTRIQKGTGLGLFIVKQLVSMHNGQIACLDVQPHGANFEIRL